MNSIHCRPCHYSFVQYYFKLEEKQLIFTCQSGVVGMYYADTPENIQLWLNWFDFTTGYTVKANHSYFVPDFKN